ncbi:MAG TPA: hypothetical protein PLV25_05320, partial [Opitutales bacterium]|nr:hypothetical protein [Opitutales bacterium]
EDTNDWAFIAPDVKVLADFASPSNKKAMIAATTAPMQDDFECIVPDNALAQAKPKRWLTSVTPSNAAVWGDVLGNRIRNLKYAWLGVSFKETAIELNVRTQARPRTPEAALLNQAAGGLVPCAQYFSTQSAFVWVVKGDPKVKWDYLQGLFKEVRPLLAADK